MRRSRSAMGWILLSIPLALSLAGCQTKQLLFTTYTKVGLDVSLSDGQPTSAMFGYKRFEGAIVPVDVCVGAKEEPAGASCEGRGGTEPDAMSVYAAMELHNGWLDGLEIIQLFATGESAVNAARNPEAFADLVRELKSEEGEQE